MNDGQLDFDAAPTHEVVGLPLTTGPYPLYGGTPPHVAGSDTSTAAAVAARPNIGRMQARILELMGPGGGWTCDELEIATGYSHQSCSARVRELVQLGRIVDSGDRRKTRGNRPARVYRIVGR